MKEPLTIDELKRVAPAAFATAPAESTSSRYNMINTLDIVNEMQKAGFSIGSARQSGGFVNRDFKRHMVRFQPASLSGVNVGEVIPQLVLVNSHDGKSSYQFSAGLFRLACSNGLMVPQATVAMVRVSHLSDAREVVDASFEIVKEFPKVISEAGSFKQVAMSEQAQANFALAASTMRYGAELKNHPVGPKRLLRPRRIEDGGSDLWSVFNRVQENIIKGGFRDLTRPRWTFDNEGRRHTAQRSVRALNSITEDSRINKGLWDLSRRVRDGLNIEALPQEELVAIGLSY